MSKVTKRLDAINAMLAVLDCGVTAYKTTVEKATNPYRYMHTRYLHAHSKIQEYPSMKELERGISDMFGNIIMKPGKKRNLIDLFYANNNDITIVQIPCGQYKTNETYAYLREHCTRGDWAACYQSPYGKLMPDDDKFYFTDKDDALLCKMRFS